MCKCSKPMLWLELETSLDNARNGDEQSKDRLFEFVRSKLLLLARYRVPEGAEDIVQESLIVILRNFSQFDSLGGLLAFSHNVLRNKVGNVYQRRDRHKRVDLVDTELPYSVDDKSDAAELDRIVQRSIRKLGQDRPDCQTILECLYFGLDPDEISERLGISKSNLKVRTFRCRQALRDLLRRDYRLEL